MTPDGKFIVKIPLGLREKTKHGTYSINIKHRSKDHPTNYS